MHIPTAETQKLDILTFEDARQHRVESVLYNREKWLYIPDFYSEYRYILGTVGKKPLITIGINPSTAQPDDLDNTLKSVERISSFNGFDSFIMFNVYAQRATDPDMMDKELNASLHNENMLAFEWILQKSEQPAIWAAWGTIIEKRPYLKKCLEDMIRIGNRYNASWFTAGKRSKKGHPHHPLYLRKNTSIDQFDIDAYLGIL
ncbi:MAG: DUF1643 domain-containing protein [Clostridia bacterium]|nr:DUF1643 domain-containing protein [Clostridia bacterium]